MARKKSKSKKGRGEKKKTGTGSTPSDKSDQLAKKRLDETDYFQHTSMNGFYGDLQLPPVDNIHDIDHSICAICDAKLEMINWTWKESGSCLTHCCGRYICSSCEYFTLKNEKEATDEVKNDKFRMHRSLKKILSMKDRLEKNRIAVEIENLEGTDADASFKPDKCIQDDPSLEAVDDKVCSIPRLLDVQSALSQSCNICKTPYPRDHKEHIFRLRRLAEAGHVEAQFKLAHEYEEGNPSAGIAMNAKKASKWFIDAAEARHVPSMAQLGKNYQSGNGVKKNVTLAKQWYEEALKELNEAKGDTHNQGSEVKVEDGDIEHKQIYKVQAIALHGMGDLYREGDGVKNNYSKALSYYRAAAEQGHPQSIMEYGCRLYEKERYEEALEWFLKGASNETYMEIFRSPITNCQFYAAQTLMQLGGMNRNKIPSALFWARRGEKNENYRAKSLAKDIMAYIQKECKYCSAVNPKKRCTACKSMFYCSSNCQRLDWKEGHKIECKAVPKIDVIINWNRPNYRDTECSYCQAPDPAYLCTTCEEACYCGEKCQNMHWEGIRANSDESCSDEDDIEGNKMIAHKIECRKKNW